MKIGILTFHDGINYGAFFQVYALRKFLVKHGFQCWVINYKDLGFTLREYKYFLDPRSLSMRQIINNIVKITKFKIAHRTLHLTNRIFREYGLAGLYFDRIILGSDEIWNFKTSMIGYNPVYFSWGLKADRIISYAASFGGINMYETVPDQLKKCLNRIKYVSVRDENSAKIMRMISEKPIQIVLDPTFLINLDAETIMPKERKFILVYGFFNKKMVQQIIDYAHFTGRKTISVSYDHSWCDINLCTLSPFQWLGYFVTCDYVVTTMYHGMIFSILNQKEFCMFRTPYRTNKLGKFPSEAGLSKRIVGKDESIRDVFAERIDYLKVNARITAQRCQSEKFLLRALQP